jgi:hypothetical protein
MKISHYLLQLTLPAFRATLAISMMIGNKQFNNSPTHLVNLGASCLDYHSLPHWYQTRSYKSPIADFNDAQSANSGGL